MYGRLPSQPSEINNRESWNSTWADRTKSSSDLNKQAGMFSKITKVYNFCKKSNFCVVKTCFFPSYSYFFLSYCNHYSEEQNRIWTTSCSDYFILIFGWTIPLYIIYSLTGWTMNVCSWIKQLSWEHCTSIKWTAIYTKTSHTHYSWTLETCCGGMATTIKYA